MKRSNLETCSTCSTTSVLFALSFSPGSVSANARKRLELLQKRFFPPPVAHEDTQTHRQLETVTDGLKNSTRDIELENSRS